jgi:methionine-rich copper-binding protein CopC
MKSILSALLPLVLSAIVTPAWAHARLTSSDPKAGASVRSPGLIRLVFSESLEPAFSGASLNDAAGKSIPVSAAVGATTITLMPLALKPGAYTVNWHGVGHDTHRVSGSIHFKVIP